MGPTSEAKLRRIQTYFKDAHATIDRRAGKLIGLYLTPSQAKRAGLGATEQTKEFYGADYAEASALATAFVDRYLPDYHI